MRHCTDKHSPFVCKITMKLPAIIDHSHNLTHSEVIAYSLDPRVESLLSGIDFSIITPSDQAELIRMSRMRGIDITTSPTLQESIKRFIAEFKNRVGALDSPKDRSNTVRSLMSNWNVFVKWCESNGIYSTLPASIETVENYLNHRFNSGVSKHSLVMDQWAIRRFHREGGCPDPTEEQRIKGLVSKLKRDLVFVHNDITQQATAMRKSVMKTLVQKWGGENATLKQMRDLAMMVLAYSTLLRGSELARVKLEHFEINSKRGAVLTIPVSKTNHSGNPDSVFIIERQMIHVYRYLAADGRSIKDKGYLFGSVSSNGKKSIRRMKSLTVQSIRHVFNEAWELTNGNINQGRPFTAHSARIGAAQDLRITDGVKIQDIMHAGRWTNEAMVLRYTRNIDAEESSSVLLQDGF